MKKAKIILGAASLLAFVGSLAFAGNSKTRFGDGTLFTKPSSGCHAVDCKRVNPSSSSFCSSSVTYYTQSDCRNSSKLPLGTQPKTITA